MSLNVIGLISGGKDSFFALAHCLENKHKIVALANLQPQSIDQDASGEDDMDDLDSFMYQTVGCNIIPLQAEALDLPLYRRAITGTATQSKREYVPTSERDETEDMYMLLQQIKQYHPEANAVCAGAILSTYQRTRVESCAVRLGLVPLSYLWQYPFLPPPDNGSRDESKTGLLDDMALTGVDARMIKLASGGIPESFLFENVASTKFRQQVMHGLKRFLVGPNAEAEFRAQVLGEGGEYETLVLNGPSPLWRRRIEVANTGTFQGKGGTYYTRIGEGHVAQRLQQTEVPIPIPATLDKRFEVIQNSMKETDLDPVSVSGKAYDSSLIVPTVPIPMLALQHQKSAFCMHIQNLSIAAMAGSGTPGLDASRQMQNIVDHLPELLLQLSELHQIEPPLVFTQTVHVKLLLRDITDFVAVNPIYASTWPKTLPLPPARVTIAAPLPRGVDVCMSLLLYYGNQDLRQGLHVQSTSYWAPANIGPYSQVISVPLLPTSGEELSTTLEVMHMAGQIPLVAARMAVLDDGLPFSEHAVLSLQHLWRVGQERKVDYWTNGVAYLRYEEDGSGFGRAKSAWEIWRQAHNLNEQGVDISAAKTTGSSLQEPVEDESVDVWHARHNRARGSTFEMTLGKHLHQLPESSFRDQENLQYPPFVAAEVTALPRNAMVEWWATGLAGIAKEANEKKVSVSSNYKNYGHELAKFFSLEVSTMEGERVTEKSVFTCLAISYQGFQTIEKLPAASELGKLAQNNTDLGRCTTILSQMYLNISAPGAQQASEWLVAKQSNVVPCYHVWASNLLTNELEEFAAVVLLRQAVW